MTKQTPKEAVRSYCTGCLGLSRWDRDMIEDCQGDQCACGPCPLYPYRMGKRPSLRAFRAHCFQCQGGSREAVIECETEQCPCHPYRLGKNPALTGKVRGASLMRKQQQNGPGRAVLRPESIFSGQGISEHG